MGDSLVNLFVRSDERDRVAEAAREILRSAYLQADSQNQLAPGAPAVYVSPAIRGWVGVFDLMMEEQDEALCEWVARRFSGAVGSVAVSFLLHDGEFIRYWLARGGKLIDRYHSAPDYYGPVATAEMKRLQGRPSLLADLCGKPLEAFHITQVLREPWAWEGAAMELLDEIGAALEIPNLLLSFNSVEEDARGGWVEGWESFRAISISELLGA